jgi:RNA-dependent RNA polymerase
VADLVEFFIEFQRNSNLGVIANTHLALADDSAQGVKDEKCKHLARLASVAVDFPKTGVPAVVPREYRPLKYPDFMEKKVSRHSGHRFFFAGSISSKAIY